MSAMPAPVIAIGLDAADPNRLETWMQRGDLPNLQRIRQQGTYGRLRSQVNYGGKLTETSSTERLWVMFGSGCRPSTTGYWSPVQFNAGDYRITHDTVNGAYDYRQYPPFWSLDKSRRVAVFDVPVAALADQVNGIQILGWGGHAPHTPSHSLPEQILPDLQQRYGKNPLLHQDYGNWWDASYLERIQMSIAKSVQARSQICQELLQQERWDLLLTVFGESHTAGHDLWHLHQVNHPLNPLSRKKGNTNRSATEFQPISDPLLTAFQHIDQAIGEIVAAAHEDAQVVIFAVHGMGDNVTDMNSMTVLPELMYRYSFPGQVAIAPGSTQRPPRSPYLHPRRKSWAGEVWQRRYDANPLKRLLMPWVPSRFDTWLNAGAHPRLTSPYEMRDRNQPLNWMPAMWYADLWPQMKAFALPAFAAGHIRINLAGREGEGIVDPADYEQTCAELTQLLYQLTDARTGRPLVKSVVNVRSQDQALSCDPCLPDADLVVLWHDRVTDVVDHPTLGRIGPITYYRTGGHMPDGFVIMKSPQVEPDTDLPTAEVIDLAPTILDLMGAEKAEYLEGRSLVAAIEDWVNKLRLGN